MLTTLRIILFCYCRPITFSGGGEHEFGLCACELEAILALSIVMEQT